MLLRSILLCFCITSYCPAQEFGLHLARFCNEQTLLVGCMDVKKFNINAYIDLLAGMKLYNQNQLHETKALLEKTRSAIVHAGVEKIYVAYQQGDLLQLPVIYVPLEDIAQAELVASLIAHWQAAPFVSKPSWLSPSNNTTWKAIDQYVAIGSEPAVNALANMKPVERPDLRAAWRAIKPGPMQVLFLPTADLRKVLGELVPKLPKELGEGSTAPYLKGIQWIALSVQTPPKLETQIVVQTDQPSSALQVQQLWQKAIAHIKREMDNPNVTFYWRILSRVLLSLQSSIRDNQFIVEASPERMAEMVKALSGSLGDNFTVEQNSINMRQLVIAMHNYHADYLKLPNQTIMSKDGKPLLSWRVSLLPFLNADNLYKQFHLDEPWDSEHNKKLISKMPSVFLHPFAQKVPEHHTLYQVFYSKKGTKPAAVIMEEGKITLGMLTVQDGTSNTMVLTDAAANAVLWTKPEDLLYDGTVANLPKLVSPRGDGFAHVVFGDGSFRRFKVNGEPKLLWQLIGRNDGAVLDTKSIFGD